MLKANRWHATVIATLAIGFVSAPAMGGAPVMQFLSVVKSGWSVAVGTKTRDQQIETIRIADRKNLNNFIEIHARNGIVEDGDVWTTAKFLNGVAGKPGADRRAELALLATPFDANRPGSLPQGLRLRGEPDGSSSITDERGSEQGRLEKGASVSDKQQIVVSAVAKRTADGLVSAASKVPPATSPALKQIADMVAADVDIALSEQPQMLADKASADQMKAHLAIDRVSTLYNRVTDQLARQGLLPGRRLYANDLKQMSEQDKFIFQFVSSRDPSKIDSYRIVDPDSKGIVASGQLTKGLGDQYYLKAEDIGNLRNQLWGDSDFLRDAVERITPSELRSQMDASEREVEKYAAETRAQSEKDPTDPKQDPESGQSGDQESTEDGQ